MPMTKRVPVKFGNPPVVEVVCGVQFSLIQPLATAHLGGYWDTIRAQYANTVDVQPISVAVEGVGASIELLSVPPLRRVWFTEPDGRHIIQVQGDRFIFNWKRVEEGEEYPSYEKVIARFTEHLSGFVQYLTDVGLGEPKFNMLEMTYVNVILKQNGLDVERPWSFLADHICKDLKDRFLPEPDAFNWTTTYPLPDSNGKLHITAQTAASKRSGEKVVKLELTARGLPPDASKEGQRAWFDLSHEWITHGFADITTQSVQETVWKRIS